MAKKKIVQWEKHWRLLGKMSDYAVADRIGISPQAVQQQREKRGISPFNKRDTRQKDIDWDAQPLGEMPDTHLAEELGVSHTTVGRARRIRGIPRYASK